MTLKLLQALSLRGMPLANRVVLAPLTRGRAGPTRVPNAFMAEYYAQRSSAGLLITEATTISSMGNGFLGSPGIYTPEMIEGWKNVTKAVHDKGGRIFLQLWHMGRASHSSFHGGQLPVSASDVAIKSDSIHTPAGKKSYEQPHPLTVEEIKATVADYRQAALNAIAAGFDGVEVHGANGYLIDQFLQTTSNKRTDNYGGTIENRVRFLNDVLDAVVSAVPANRVGVRLSPNGAFNEMGSPDYKELFSHAMAGLDKFNLAYLHVMDGLAFGFHKLGTQFTLKDVRKVFRGPVIGNCGYTQETAEAAVQSGDADMIAFGRPYISNPDLVERFANGWPLARPAPMGTWYGFKGAVGYTDFPAYTPKASL
jgi:N-ethylmaleimide reductase